MVVNPLILAGEAIPEIAPPLLSFILVNWNYGRFIAQTLKSILSQTYTTFECIIVDNGSSDDSLQVIERHIGTDERFSVIALPTNLGQLGGVFVGLRAASGAFVALIDADDVLLPAFAAVHIQVHLALRDNAAITSSNVIEVDSDNKVLSSSYAGLRTGLPQDRPALRDEQVVVRLASISSELYSRELMKRVSMAPRHVEGWLWSPGTSNVMRRSIAELFTQPGNAPRMRAADNYFFKLCHAFAGTATIDMPLSTRRIHDSNYFACRETMPTFQSGSPEFRKTLNINTTENIAIVLQYASRNAWMLGSHFWDVIDQLTQRRGLSRWKYYRSAEVVTLFQGAACELLETVGAVNLVRNIRLRFSLRNSLRILNTAFGGSIPAQLWILLLPWPRFSKLFQR